MRRLRLALGLILLLLPALACDVPSIQLGREPTPVPTAQPLGDTLVLTVPLYRIGLEPGDSVPGAQLTYVGSDAGAYQVRIDGLPAVRRSGDSFSWYGVVAPGVIGNYNLRLSTTLLGKLVATGSVTLSIFNPEPEALATEPTADDVAFANVAVQYYAPAGSDIPGTTLRYEGLVEPGGPEGVSQPMARLSGVRGYPYFAFGDSITWTGRLRDNVIVRYTFRVAALDANGLRVAGSADLWITE